MILRLDPLAVSEGVPYSALEIAASFGDTTEAFNKLAAHTEESHKKSVCQLLRWACNENKPSDKFKELLCTIPAAEVEQDKSVKCKIHSNDFVCRWNVRPYRRVICCSIWLLMGKLLLSPFCSSMGETLQPSSCNSLPGSTRKLLLERILTLLSTAPGRTTTLQPWGCWRRWQNPPSR